MKMTYTPEELTAFDLWIAKYILGLEMTEDPDSITNDPKSKVYIHKGKCVISHTYSIWGRDNNLCVGFEPPPSFGQSWENYQPTTDAEDAFRLLEMMARDYPVGLLYQHAGGFWTIGHPDSKYEELLRAPTMHLAICEYAKHLWTHRTFGAQSTKTFNDTGSGRVENTCQPA